MADYWRIGRAALNFIGGDIDDRYTRPPSPYIQAPFMPGQEEWIQVDGREGETYNTCAPLAIVIDKIGQMTSVGKIRHWKGNKNTKEDTELFNTPELNLFYNPNPLQSKDDFLREMSVHRNVFGVAYPFGAGFVNRGLSGTPKVIWNMQPEFVSYETTGKLYMATEFSEIFKKIWFDKGGNGEMAIDPNDILFRSVGNAINLIAPQSPLTKIRQELSNIIAAMAYRNVILRRKGAIGILSGDQRDADGTVPLDPNEFSRIEKEYQSGWGLYNRQMQILMAKYPMKWTPMTYPTKDLLLFEEVDENMGKVIDLYGAHKDLFSLGKGSTLAESGGKMVEAARQTYQTKIIPQTEDDMNAFSKWLGLHKKGEYLTLDYSHVPAMQDNDELAAKIMSLEIAAFVSLMSLEKGVNKDEAMQMCGLKEG